MANPLFQALGGGKLPGPMGNFQQMMQQFRQFRQSFQGDPKAEVEKLVQSGKLSQQQLNQLQQAAMAFQHLMK
nr:MAG TPA: Protein of unknown function (DUF2680) [Caudoviricetes sp.]DAG39391.1 MAG TPA: Protein of unknown function (DUF2680) [Caudoviricetes sp.]DAJ43816.1 MAG TPA: Protein of unknown function (DUF2680) [Caudoviricetes sp.]DAP69610.1 MAG TPA: Protein of unknown function (DUF2680) [Caudoviricetes sp.]